jgi:hypothetical protein
MKGRLEKLDELDRAIKNGEVDVTEKYTNDTYVVRYKYREKESFTLWNTESSYRRSNKFAVAHWFYSIKQLQNG